jgi:hypothetical protein
MKESVLMVKPLIRGLIIGILAINLQENFEIGTLGYSMVVYAMSMKCFNVVIRQVKEFENA